MEDINEESEDFQGFGASVGTPTPVSQIRPQSPGAQSIPVDTFMKTVTVLLQQNAQMLELLQQRLTPQAKAGISNPQETSRGFNVMPDLSKSIATFDGELGTSAKDWLNQLESMALLHSWPEAIMVQTAISQLKVAAKSWYSVRSRQITNWQHFRSAFEKTFVFEPNEIDLWTKMQSHVQHTNESLSAYFHKKVALCRELNFSFNEIKEQVIGLLSLQLSNFLMFRMHTDEDVCTKTPLIMKEFIEPGKT